MTNPPVAPRSDMLRLRIVSAAVMIPVALAAVWFGYPWVEITVGLAGSAMAWEWGRLTSGQFGLHTAIIMVAVVVAVAAATADRFSSALAVAAMGAVLSAMGRRAEWGWTGIGTLWIACGCIAFVWLDKSGGRTTIIWLLAVVWATDIFAYFFGKTIGGPRLVPQFSPNKTWAGLVGGLIGGVGAGVAAAIWAGTSPVQIGFISLGLSLVSQGGDLAESSAKRHFAVKDASHLIPGHGGVLDRLDGLLAATIAAALLTFIRTVHFG